MAELKYLNSEGLTKLVGLIKADLANKVDVDGDKVLSTNDFTDELKTKLDGIDEGAKAVSASEATPVVAGTAAVGTDEGFARGDHVHPAQTDVTGNAGTATKLANEVALTVGATEKKFDGSAAVAWTAAEIASNATTTAAGWMSAEDKTKLDGIDVDASIAAAVADITSFTMEIVLELPESGVTGTIYLLKKEDDNENVVDNFYEEYLYVNNKFEKIGDTELDLSGYVQEANLKALNNTEIAGIWNDTEAATA